MPSDVVHICQVDIFGGLGRRTGAKGIVGQQLHVASRNERPKAWLSERRKLAVAYALVTQ
jgi:hypothetical protein